MKIIDRRGQYDVAVARADLNVRGKHLRARLDELVERILGGRNPYPADNPMSRLDATDDPVERERIRNGL